MKFILKAIQQEINVDNLKVYANYSSEPYCIGRFLFVSSEELKKKADFKYKKIFFEGSFNKEISKQNRPRRNVNIDLMGKLPEGSKQVTYQEMIDSMNGSNNKFMFFTFDPFTKKVYYYDFENGNFLGYVQSDYRSNFPLDWIVEVTLKVYPQFRRR